MYPYFLPQNTCGPLYWSQTFHTEVWNNFSELKSSCFQEPILVEAVGESISLPFMTFGDEASAFHVVRPFSTYKASKAEPSSSSLPTSALHCLLLGFAYAPHTSLACLPIPISLVVFTELLLLGRVQKTKFVKAGT